MSGEGGGLAYLPCKLIVADHKHIVKLILIKQLQQIEGIRVVVINDQRP